MSMRWHGRQFALPRVCMSLMVSVKWTVSLMMSISCFRHLGTLSLHGIFVSWHGDGCLVRVLELEKLKFELA